MNTILLFRLMKEVFCIYPARRCFPLAIAAALLLPVASISAAGLAGKTSGRQSDGSSGPPIADVALSFVKEDSSAAFSAKSDAKGQYSISLDPGRYFVLATHPDYEDYTSVPGFSEVSTNAQGTADFFLRKPRITTVLVVRHGEKSDDETLTDEGENRAERLRDVLSRAGITAVYSTDTSRTLGTVKPLADLFRLPTPKYNDGEALARTVLAKHRGDVILVAGHSDSVGKLANAFGASVPKKTINDFDNLYIVSLSHEGTKVTNVVNLQYGADSPDDHTKKDPQAMTLLLVGASGSGNPKAEELLHTATKAGVSAIFANAEHKSLVARLATNLPSRDFDASNLKAFAKQLISNHSKSTVVVAGNKTELDELIRELGGSPFRAVDDKDDLIVLTRFESGAVRLVPMRY